MESPLLSATGLTVTVPGRTLVEALDFALDAGEFVALLGQNGAGKTLTLETLAGLRPAAAGAVRLDGADLFSSPRQAVARRLALLPQAVDDIFPATVLDTALIGRHPHIRGLRWETRADVAIAREALATVGLGALASRDVLTLSGGERRRVAIAQILTQAPAVFLLDEPTNHLDPQHQIETMQLFRAAADRGAGVVASLHDVNLAVRFADRCLLLFGDGQWRLGPTATVLDTAALGELYVTPMDAVSWQGRELFVPAGERQSTKPASRSR
ncbi:MAG: ABC transporter ATP-binding protein [Woeseiaceae bacterium]|nr:ABC transporter ATP-binding protein [Woeseiaceae bacterium]